MKKLPFSKEEIEKYLSGESTKDLEYRVDNWYKDFDDEIVEVGQYTEEKEVSSRISAKLSRSIEFRRRSFAWTAKVAASIALIFSFLGGIVYVYKKDSDKDKAIAFSGRQIGAILKVGSGSSDAEGNTTLDNAHYNEEGFYSLNKAAKAISNKIDLVVPRGRQYKIELSDGTKVWVNSDSEISFPEQFGEDERIVYLKGQAYFEVQKDANRPFVVETENQRIKVLGTHFEVKSYAEEKFEETALLEGKVEISSRLGSDRKVLSPGQMVKVDLEQGTLTQERFENRALWVNNVFAFENETLQDILANVSRWYNIDVLFDTAATGRTFTGKIKQDATLQEVLDMLSLVSGKVFKIKDNKIVVM